MNSIPGRRGRTDRRTNLRQVRSCAVGGTACGWGQRASCATSTAVAVTPTSDPVSDPSVLGAVKVFISSVVGGLEPFRDAAAEVAALLRHEVKRSEDFGASTEAPQQACLAGVRWADVVVLLLGVRYGDPQPSGISATHEEYREGKSRCPVLALVQQGSNGRRPRRSSYSGLSTTVSTRQEPTCPGRHRRP